MGCVTAGRLGRPLSNMRLKPSGLFLKESGVASPGAPRPGAAGPLRPQTHRPQLKRGSLGGD